MFKLATLTLRHQPLNKDLRCHVVLYLFCLFRKWINMNTKFYKYCAVPLCKNTSVSAPEKLFIHVPKNKPVRRKWLTLAKRDPASLTVTTTSYFCEDHFDLPNDMENYMQYTTMGTVSQIRMKSGCLPTKFACQKSSDSSRAVTAKRQRDDLIKKELDQITPSLQCETILIELPGTSSDLIKKESQEEGQQTIKMIKIDKAVQTSHVIIISAKCRSKSTQTDTTNIP